MHVLIVEDERRIASFVARGLSREGYAVQAVADGGAHWRVLRVKSLRSSCST